MKKDKTINLVFAASLMSLATINSQAVSAQTHCYNFDNPAVGTEYHEGQTLNTQHADINVLRFINGRNPGKATISDSLIIDDAKPSLLIRTATVQVLPDQRVQSVTLRYAENVPG